MARVGLVVEVLALVVALRLFVEATVSRRPPVKQLAVPLGRLPKALADALLPEVAVEVSPPGVLLPRLVAMRALAPQVQRQHGPSPFCEPLVGAVAVGRAAGARAVHPSAPSLYLPRQTNRLRVWCPPRTRALRARRELASVTRARSIPAPLPPLVGPKLRPRAVPRRPVRGPIPVGRFRPFRSAQVAPSDVSPPVAVAHGRT